MRNIVMLTATAVLAITLGGCNKQANESGTSATSDPVEEPLMGAAVDKLMEDARAVFKPIPLNSPKLEGNEATPEKLALGRMLYFDPRLSASHAIGTPIDETGTLLRERGGYVLGRDLGGRWKLDLHRVRVDMQEKRVRITGVMVAKGLVDVDGIGEVG